METEAVTNLIDVLFTGSNLILYAAVYAITQTVKVIFPKTMKKKLVQRILPALPILLAVLGAVVGLSSGTTWQERIAFGVIIGALAGQTFKIGKTSLLGKGIEEPEPPEAPKF